MNRLLHALKFSAERHIHQRRKDAEATPYINHPIEIAEHLARVGGIFDEDVLIAGLLHDTVEDTSTTMEEIEDLFGARVAGIVLECTDDKSLPRLERKRLQIVTASNKSRDAKCVKLADKTCNLSSLLLNPPSNWGLLQQQEYVEWAAKVVQGLVGVNQRLDECALEVLAKVMKALGCSGK